eukprot:CAMPEP_0183306566 /NCGR_PEP_ID=MMETSP0160_2-20130417/12731_1 /TAXON_ID=2839 ORGANISM="Odontella Sinensis, Strain Grunow 1884" /NCGR_SAMPLE_ID=MMETSP0160_2 /ASSEMBLY_ACC=CAM_ASM_000250 /LENGTH=206 /DNA_ID=CAMNT_0025469975 /DNA_START=22 /DNA_END=642 /DNA_ORIENTATION=+
MASRLAKLLLLLAAAAAAIPASAFAPSIASARSNIPLRMAPNAGDDDDKFSFAQRIESVKCLVVGSVSGGVALTPFTALHNLLLGAAGDATSVQNGLAQFEFDTDMGAVQAGLFAIVYRYCVREDTNPMLAQGVVGAFVLTRTLGRVSIPTYCSAAPLDCGAPLGYLDWSVLTQLALNGAEGAALFGVAAAAMEYSFGKGFISKFR